MCILLLTGDQNLATIANRIILEATCSIIVFLCRSINSIVRSKSFISGEKRFNGASAIHIKRLILEFRIW